MVPINYILLQRPLEKMQILEKLINISQKKNCLLRDTTLNLQLDGRLTFGFLMLVPASALSSTSWTADSRSPLVRPKQWVISSVQELGNISSNICMSSFGSSSSYYRNSMVINVQQIFSWEAIIFFIVQSKWDFKIVSV